MGSPFGTAIVIVGPEAGKWARDPRELGDLLRGVDIDFEVSPARRRGHPEELARAAIAQGHRYVVAVGGDLTIHEVVNGLMDEQGSGDPRAVLGFVSAGPRSDLTRTFGLPANPQAAVTYLTGDNIFDVDVGRVTYSRDGTAMSRWFANVAQAGLGGELVGRAGRLPRPLGRVRDLFGFWMALAAFSPTKARLVLDDRSYEGPITNLVVANAQFFRNGMRIAPKAHPSDGKFDVLIMKGTKRDYIEGLSKAPRGGHLPSPAIKEYHATKVEVEAAVPLWLEADGEALGLTPATFEVVPQALRIKI